MAQISLVLMKDKPYDSIVDHHQYFSVKKVLVFSSPYAILEYNDDNINDPNSDPLILTVIKPADSSDLIPCAIWRNKLWEKADDSIVDFLNSLSQVNPKKFKAFAEKLRGK